MPVGRRDRLPPAPVGGGRAQDHHHDGEMIMKMPTAHIPALSLPVNWFSAPVAYGGAANPPRLPIELISPMPPAAAAPVRN